MTSVFRNLNRVQKRGGTGAGLGQAPSFQTLFLWDTGGGVADGRRGEWYVCSRVAGSHVRPSRDRVCLARPWLPPC